MEMIESPAVEYLSGSPGNPMSQEAITAKFIDCAAHAVKPLPEKKLNALIELILHMEDVKDVSEIAKYFIGVIPKNRILFLSIALPALLLL